MKEQLIKNLKAAGYPTLEVEGKEGGSILILPYGGRVLGIFCADSWRNFFWVNPLLLKADKAGEFFTNPGWKNSGGDRTWIAPEIELFIKNPKDALNTYQVSESIDPGSYSVSRREDSVSLANRAEIFNHRLNKSCEIELNKTIRAVKNPLRYERKFGAIAGGIKFIGYEEETILKLSDKLPPKIIRLGIWNLIQVPSGGEMLIPTLSRSSPRNYFGKTGARQLQVSPNMVRFIVYGKACCKIGLKAVSVTGRMGYLLPSAKDKWSLTVRNFSVNPSGEYIDTPWDDPYDFGYAVQCYNDDGKIGDFGEMEYHTPAIGGKTGWSEYTDRSQVWAFSGEEKSIKEISRLLLGKRKNGV